MISPCRAVRKPFYSKGPKFPPKWRRLPPGARGETSPEDAGGAEASATAAAGEAIASAVAAGEPTAPAAGVVSFLAAAAAAMEAGDEPPGQNFVVEESGECGQYLRAGYVEEEEVQNAGFFTPGATVRIHGLTSEAGQTLNGQLATVEKPRNDGGYRVRLSDGSVKSIKAANLQDVADAEEQDTTVAYIKDVATAATAAALGHAVEQDPPSSDGLASAVGAAALASAATVREAASLSIRNAPPKRNVKTVASTAMRKALAPRGRAKGAEHAIAAAALGSAAAMMGAAAVGAAIDRQEEAFMVASPQQQGMDNSRDID